MAEKNLQVKTNYLSTSAKPRSMESLRELIKLGMHLNWEEVAHKLDQLGDQELDEYDTIPEHTAVDMGRLQTALEKKNQYIQKLEKQLEINDKQLLENASRIETLEVTVKSQNNQGKFAGTSQNVKLQKEIKVNERLQENLEKANKHIKEMQEHIDELTSAHDRMEKNVNQTFLDESERHRKEIEKILKEKKESQVQSENLQQELRGLKIEHEETKNRLSKLMSARVTDNNPDIADLSDVNRPNKLAEMYQELYDNEWSDVFDYFSNADDKTKLTFLLNLLMDARQFCAKEAEKQTGKINSALFTDQIQKSLPDSVKTDLKGIKKVMIPHNLDILQQKFLYGNVREKYRHIPEIGRYVEECVKVCWIMALNDPPIVFAHQLKRGEKIDTSHYKSYTEKGDRCDYVVWPALIMSEGGALVTKGVAQALRVIRPTSGTASSHRADSSYRPRTSPVSGNLNIHGFDEDISTRVSSSPVEKSYTSLTSGSVHDRGRSTREKSYSVRERSPTEIADNRGHVTDAYSSLGTEHISRNYAQNNVSGGSLSRTVNPRLDSHYNLQSTYTRHSSYK